MWYIEYRYVSADNIAKLHLPLFNSKPEYIQDIVAKLSFRGQRVFLHNASGWFGDAPVEASGDFGLNPEDGEFHLMCQVL
jgi:hypothetical protein